MPNWALEGIRIIDNGIVQAGTWASRLLADFGAEVIRVENYHMPDVSRMFVYPENEAGSRFWEQGGTYHEQHLNKRYCVGMDLKTPLGVEVFKKLVSVSDVVLESNPPRVMKGFGLDYPELAKVNPGIIMISTCGYGHNGPYSDFRSYGMQIEPMSGLTWLTGYKDGPPRRGTIPYPDQCAAYHGAFAIMSALEQRRHTGKGQWIDVANYEVAASEIGEAYMDYFMNGRTIPRMGNRHPTMAPCGCYPCKGDDNWIALSVSDDEEWQALGRALGNPSWFGEERFADQASRGQHQDELDGLISKWTREREDYECMHILQGAGVPAGVVLSPKALMLDPHLKDRELFQFVEHSPLQENVGKRLMPGPAAKMSKTPGEIQYRAPMLGEHNEEVIRNLLSYSKEQYEEIVQSGAVGTDPIYAGLMIPPTISAEEQLRLGRIRSHDPDYRQMLGIADS